MQAGSIGTIITMLLVDENIVFFSSLFLVFFLKNFCIHTHKLNRQKKKRQKKVALLHPYQIFLSLDNSVLFGSVSSDYEPQISVSVSETNKVDRCIPGLCMTLNCTHWSLALPALMDVLQDPFPIFFLNCNVKILLPYLFSFTAV